MNTTEACYRIHPSYHMDLVIKLEFQTRDRVEVVEIYGLHGGIAQCLERIRRAQSILSAYALVLETMHRKQQRDHAHLTADLKDAQARLQMARIFLPHCGDNALSDAVFWLGDPHIDATVEAIRSAEKAIFTVLAKIDMGWWPALTPDENSAFTAELASELRAGFSRTPANVFVQESS